MLVLGDLKLDLGHEGAPSAVDMRVLFRAVHHVVLTGRQMGGANESVPVNQGVRGTPENRTNRKRLVQ